MVRWGVRAGVGRGGRNGRRGAGVGTPSGSVRRGLPFREGRGAAMGANPGGGRREGPGCAAVAAADDGVGRSPAGSKGGTGTVRGAKPGGGPRGHRRGGGGCVGWFMCVRIRCGNACMSVCVKRASVLGWRDRP